jgi:DNA-binding response OmpR family regulator
MLSSAMALRTILLVDDEPDIRKIGAMSLQAVGKWTVLQASTAEQAIEIAARERPDLIILDVMMPGQDGPQTLAALRARADTASIPVVFMTAKMQRHEVEEYVRLGAIGVIGKPFDPMRLPAEIRALYARVEASS